MPLSNIRKNGHPIMGYIDDFLLVNKTFKESEHATLYVSEVFRNLGFVVHPEKSSFLPKQEITFLGFIIDSKSMTLTITEKRRNKLRTLLNILINIKMPKIRFVAKVLGHITSVMPASKFGPLHYRNLENDKVEALKCRAGDFESTMKISAKGLEDLKWWIFNINSTLNWIHPPAISEQLTTDASDFAWGGVTHDNAIGGSWDYEERSLHINVKEMLAILFSLKSFKEKFEKQHVNVLCDNTTAIAVINKMGSSKSTVCNETAHKIWEFCENNNTWITCTFIPGKNNVEADFQSRKDYKQSNWMLNKDIFVNICKKLNYNPDVDCFANRLNHQIDRYMSYKPDPSACHIDAFSTNWSNFQGYFFPPFSLMGRTLQKIYVDGATALVVAPDWPTQPWYTTMIEMMTESPIKIQPAQKNLILPEDPSQLHPLWKSLGLVAFVISGQSL